GSSQASIDRFAASSIGGTSRPNLSPISRFISRRNSGHQSEDRQRRHYRWPCVGLRGTMRVVYSTFEFIRRRGQRLSVEGMQQRTGLPQRSGGRRSIPLALICKVRLRLESAHTTRPSVHLGTFASCI